MKASKETTLIIGSGICAEQLAAQLADIGMLPLVTTAESAFPVDSTGVNSSIEVLTNTTIHACRQTVNGFHLGLINGNNRFTRTVSNIVVVEQEQRNANFSQYGLRPSKSVISLSKLTQGPDTITDELSDSFQARTIVFLTGLFSESNPVIAAEVMQAAHDLQTDSPSIGKTFQTYILTKNLKVAADGLEALYRKTKEAGTVYVKFTDRIPDIFQKKDEVHITFTDEVTELPFRLAPDIIVVDETILPSERIDELAAVFGLEQDEGGFAQADNVHRLPVFTNRNGIYIAGSSRNIVGSNDLNSDAANAALTVSKWTNVETPLAEGKAWIDRGSCVRCLTCYRLCPYKAISLDVYPAVVPVACERCGICAAECPQHAIDIQGLEQQEIMDRIGLPATDLSGDPFIPFIVAFCCSRSGSQAARLATLMGQNLPEGLKIVEVPCAGSLSAEHIFSGCRLGADGILVLTCHNGNCHSTKGNIVARSRIDHLKERLMKIGYDVERLDIQTLASNMGTEFAALTQRFAKRITELGPSPLHR